MGSLLVIASAFGFSTLAIFGKIAYEMGFTRNQMLTWRFGLSLPFLFLILLKLKALPQNKMAFSKAIALGAVGIGVEATFFFMTLERVGAALTGIFLYLYPAFVALISHFFLKERMSGLKWACVGLSLLGCFLTVDLQGSHIKDSSGVIFGVCTALGYALYLLTGNRIMKNENPLTVGSGIVLGSFITFGALAWLDVGVNAIPFQSPSSVSSWGVLLGMALLASVVPFTTLYAGMKKSDRRRPRCFRLLRWCLRSFLLRCFLVRS